MKQGTRKILVSFLLILAMLSGMIPGAAMPAMAEEPLIEEALPEQLETAPAEETLIKDAAPTEPAEQILIEGETPAKPTELPNGVVNDTDGLVAERTVTAPALYASDGDEREPGNAELFMNPDDLPVETDVTKLNGSNWMAGIRGDRYLNEFNIPYTHDAAMADYIYHQYSSVGSALGGGRYAITQAHYINEQLERGVRILDLRLNNKYEIEKSVTDVPLLEQITDFYNIKVCETIDDGRTLFFCHGKKSDAGVYWAANERGNFLTIHQVLKMVKDFLQKNPTETVILDFSPELLEGEDWKYGPIIAGRLNNIISQLMTEENPSTHKPYIYTEPGLPSWDTAYTHMPQLKDCRGQAVLLYQSQYFEGKFGGMKRSIVADNDILGGKNTVKATTKVALLQRDMREFDVDLPAYNEHLNMLRIIDTNSHADTVWDVAGEKFVADKKPTAIAEYVHPRVFGEGKLLSQPGRYYGWVKMDVATRGVCRSVYMTNFPTASSGENETVTLTVDPGNPTDPQNAAYYANYEQQSYKLPKGATFDVPGDLYDVHNHNRPYSNTASFLYWQATDTEGNTEKRIYSGQSFRIDKDLTFTPIYDPNYGKYTQIWAMWDDGGNIDRLRPESNELDVDVIYLDTDGRETHTLVTLKASYDSFDNSIWRGHFTGNLIDLRPYWKRVPTGEGYEHGLNGKETYSYELKGDLARDPVVYVTLHHTVIETKYKTVSGIISWEDRFDFDLRPESVRLQLLRDGEPYGDIFTVSPPAAATDGDAADGDVKDYWTWEIQNVPVNDYDKIFEYSVRPVDTLAAYQPEVNGTDVHFVHEATDVSRDVQVVWVDNDDEARIRPQAVHVHLSPKDENGYNVSGGIGTIITDWTTRKTLTAHGKFQSNYTFELGADPVVGYDTTVEWIEGSGEDTGYYLVTNTLIPGYKPSELGGVFKAARVGDNDIRGDWIDFGMNGTYVDNGESELYLCYGIGELTWMKYLVEEGSHVFTVGSRVIKVKDEVMTPPWGIEVTGGDGTKDNPYTFQVLRREAVAYWEGVLDEDGYVAYTRHYTSDYRLITEDTAELEAGKWYVLSEDVTLNNRLMVESGAPVHLILRNGAILMADYGIGVDAGATLNIHTEREYDVSAGIYANLQDIPGAAIGADDQCGTIIVHNGTVDASTTNSSSDLEHVYPAIGGSGSLIVYDGIVNARVAYSGKLNQIQNAIGDDMHVAVYGGGSVYASALSPDSSDTKILKAIIGPITTGPGIGVYNGYFGSGEPSAEHAAEKDENGDYVRTPEMTIREGHIHNFVYEEKSGKLLATCKAANCNLDNSRIVLTINPPKQTTYDPNAAEDDLMATLGDWLEFSRVTHTNITPESIKYYKMQDDANKFITKPTKEAGDYMAQVSLPGMTTDIFTDGGTEQVFTGTVSATVYYTIEKVQVELTAFEAINFTYGRTLDSLTTTRNHLTINPEVPGVLAWQDGSIIPPAGTDQEYTLIFTPDDLENYEIATCKMKVNVKKAAPTVTPPEAISPVIYSEDEDPVLTGSAVGGIMLYAVGENPPTDDADWQYSVPAITEPGTYTLWYKVFGDSNYTDTVPQCITVTVSAEGGFTLPVALVTIGEEAFAGIPVSRVEFTENVKTIGPRAFADCKNLREFVVPATVESIDDTALAGCTNVTVYGDIGSEAERFASDNGFMFASWNDSWIGG